MIPQVVQSAQVWECRSCGSRDHKSCSCQSTAITVKLLEKAEKVVAKAEQQRVAARERMQRVRERNVDNVEQFPTKLPKQPTLKDMEDLILEQLEEFQDVLIAYIGPRTPAVVKALRYHIELCDDLINAKD